MGSPTDVDWLGPLAARGPVPGLAVPLTVSWLVQKGPDGDVRLEAVFAPDPAGANGDPVEVELTSTHAVALALASGETSPNVAWMRGRLKAAGPTGPLLAVLAHAEAATA